MFGFEHLDTQMQRLEQFLVYSDDSHREIETVNLLVARNIPVTFAKPASAIISELEVVAGGGDPGSAALSTAPKKTKPALPEPEVRKAKPVYPAKPALPYSPGVKKYHSSPPPLPVRKAIPLQRFNQESNGNG